MLQMIVPKKNNSEKDYKNNKRYRVKEIIKVEVWSINTSYSNFYYLQVHFVSISLGQHELVNNVTFSF